MQAYKETAVKLRIDRPFRPPEWAALQQQLMDKLNRAAEEFVGKYVQPDGTLLWRSVWPGMDGSDDPYEGFMNLALLYVLGGHRSLYEHARKVFDGITWQWTEYGQIHREFDGYYDWMHHGEGSLFFYFLGLADPDSLKDRQRARRFAQMYTGEDPEAPNYDSERKLIRSPINGSRGPRFVMTEEDWMTHRGILDDYLAPFEDLTGVDIKSGKCPWSDDRVYKEIIQKMNERMAKGDVPLNLNATSLIAHAFMHSGEEKLRQWVIEYVGAWRERAEANGGIMPDNVGLSGVIGEYNEGKWWGGYYGWRWSHGLFTIVEPLTNAAMNAVLLTGDRNWLDVVRRQLDLNWELRRQLDGKWLVPHKHLDSGWTDYKPANPAYPIYLWTISMDPQDIRRYERLDIAEFYKEVEIPIVSGRNPHTGKETKHYIANTVPWFEYIRGNDPSYPEKILKANLTLVERQLDKMRSPEGEPAGWITDGYNLKDLSSIHKWQEMCPVYPEGLLQLTLGAPMHISHGGLQHARVRYYDAAARRPGLPPRVSALVERIEDDSVTLTLVNLDETEEKEVVIQAGGFGEHRFTSAEVRDERGETVQSVPVRGKWLQIQLGREAGAKLVLTMERYVNRPSYETPWEPECPAPLIQSRTIT
ncbi:hypothetical protein [Cohnella zeiphila]|uniref:Uncharacterized protein n=1 Tax=Cohnella zeiphila TaxID=2761120 RepID=A0A7X0W062_9BACL|nr:hypothetical protein [Cohnella zeiphila]MBB6734723.1 hypothetical protein [Cohnella zeiphila]